jgi:hypothetical protein
MSLYSYYAHEVHRDWLERFEREAELQRLLPARDPRRLAGLRPLPRRRRHQPRPDARGAC